jgi:hypothetical protein
LSELKVVKGNQGIQKTINPLKKLNTFYQAIVESSANKKLNFQEFSKKARIIAQAKYSHVKRALLLDRSILAGVDQLRNNQSFHGVLE